MGARGWEERGVRSCLIASKFQFGKMIKFRRRMVLMVHVLNVTELKMVRMVKMSKMVYILPQ